MTTIIYEVKRPVVIGLDPGPERSAVVLLCGRNILDPAWLANEDVLTWLTQRASRDKVLAIETLFPRAEPVSRDAMEGQLFAGRCIQVAAQWQMRFVKVDTNDARLAVTGNPQAKDKHIRLGLLNIFGDKREVACETCGASGMVAGVRQPKKCPACKGEKRVFIPGPLAGVGEHERSALAAAYYVQEVVLVREANAKDVA